MPYKDTLKQREYAKNHYEQNKQKYLKSNRDRRSLLKSYIRELKSNTPCKDCHKSYPYYVMDFDHLRDKDSLIIKFIRNNNRAGLENELKKCEVVCSNCHRIRSYNRLNYRPNFELVM